MTGGHSAHQPPPGSSGDWDREMIPATYSAYDPETASTHAQLHNAQNYQAWIDSYQQQQQQQQQQQPHSSYPPFGRGNTHQFRFPQPASPYNQSAGQFGAQNGNPYGGQGDVFGYYPTTNSNGIHPPSQNHPQAQGNFYHDAQSLSPDMPKAAQSSRASSHGHSPSSWTDETAIFDLAPNPTTQSTSTLPSSSSHGVTASHGHQQPQNINQANNTAVSTHAPASSSTSRPTGKRKRGARRSPVDSLEQHTAYKRSRDRESDDDSDDGDDFGISVGVGGLTGASGTVSGRRGKTVRL
ncbi:hypothetical protein V5O48_015182 [Marasmius crinis-equi]|uniref:Uncharacterized protein n=1 Tax=Marasmius crinis-equi TaxID=585013 RepID=A0ABR3EV80_9AGAR